MHPVPYEVDYETDYIIEDAVLCEPFKVLKPTKREGFAWWNGNSGRGKVERLFSAFKTDFTIAQACFYAGITPDQYSYFCKVHPAFSAVKPRLKALLTIAVKHKFADDIVDPKNVFLRQRYLERVEPETYGRKY
jgi:hypothetical protein